MDPFSCSRFGLNEERERLRWSRMKRKRKMEKEIVSTEKSPGHVSQPAVDVSMPMEHTLHDAAPLKRAQTPSPAPTAMLRIRVPSTMVEDASRVAIVGLTQVRLEASGSVANLKNLSAFTAVDTHVLMWYAVGATKSYHVFFEVRETKVHAWACTHSCRSRAAFLERASAVVDSLRGSGDVEGVSRARVVSWHGQRVRAEWGRAIRALSAMEVGACVAYPWDSVYAALASYTTLPARKWMWKDFVAAHETTPRGKKLKYLAKASNVSLDVVCRAMNNEPSANIFFTTLDRLKKQ